METLIGIGIFVAINVILSLISNASQKANIEQERKANTFSIKVIEDTVKGENYDWQVLSVQMKGLIECPSDKTPVRYIVQLADITGERKAILSSYKDFQDPSSGIFQYRSDEEILPYTGTIFSSWSNIINIPKNFLEFPMSGTRTVEATVSVVQANNRVLAKAIKTFTYVNSEKGYLDREEESQYYEEMVIKTAMLISASDGKLDSNEASVIKSWVTGRISYLNKDNQKIQKQRLNSYIKEAYEDIDTNDFNIYEILEGIENIASEGEKYDLFQICLDVAKADGVANSEEIKLIHEIANYIKLDNKQYKSMIEKTLPVTMHDFEMDDETLLGINTEMTKKEVRQHLGKEYQKWHRRVTSSNPKVREEAEIMINKIAEVRKRYT